MTKQEFLDGKEFKTNIESYFSYKYLHGSIARKDSEDTWYFDAIVQEMTDESVTVMNTVLGGFLKVKKNFSELILV